MNRRTFTLSAVASCAVVTALSARADTKSALRVAYVPLIGSAALMVFVGSGMAKAAGLDVTLTSIDTVKSDWQTAIKTFDAVAVGVSAVARARLAGDDLRIIASLSTAGAGFVAVPALAMHFYAAGGDPAKAFAAFKAKTGHNARIATMRTGSVPWLLLDSWLFQRNAVPQDLVDIQSSDSAEVVSALLAGRVEAATLTEPVSTILRDRDPHLQRIVSGGAMCPDLPGVVLGADGSAVSARPETYNALVRGVVAATHLIRTDPAQASTYVQDKLGLAANEIPLVAKALTSSNIGFVTDPRTIVGSTRTMLDAEAEVGVLPHVGTAELFDNRFFSGMPR